MTANNVEQDLLEQVRALRAQVENLSRSPSSRPYKRDLRDCRQLTKIQDGQTDVFDSATGEWVPTDFPTGGGGTSIPPFVLSGSLYIATSEKWPPPASVPVARLYAVLTAAGATSTTVELLKNGAVVGTLVIPASSLAFGADITPVTFNGPEADEMQMRTTAVGAGAAGLTVQPS